MKFNVIKKEKYVLVDVQGLDEELGTYQKFSKKLKKLASKKHPIIVLDFRKSAFFVSTAIGVLVDFEKQVKENGGRIYILADKDSDTYKIFVIVGVTAVMGTFFSEEELQSVISSKDQGV